MIEHHQEVSALILKHLRHELTEEENVTLTNWVSDSAINFEFFMKCIDTEKLYDGLCQIHRVNKSRGWAQVQARLAVMRADVASVVKHPDRSSSSVIRITRYLQPL